MEILKQDQRMKSEEIASLQQEIASLQQDQTAKAQQISTLQQPLDDVRYPMETRSDQGTFFS